jgi:hypothetical protein
MKALTGKTMGKLRSRRGASLLAALFVFLVCSVIGIVVVTAATAAAGRASKLAENDQRYFSVASAAELLTQELSGKPVTIQRVKTTEEIVNTDYTLEGSEFQRGTPTYADGYPTTQYLTVVSTKNSEGEGAEWDVGVDCYTFPDHATLPRSFLTELAIRLLFGAPDAHGEIACNTEEAFALGLAARGSGAEADKGEFDLSHSVTELGIAEKLKIKGSYSLHSDGTLILTLWNDDGDDDIFSLVLTMQPEFQETESTDVTAGLMGRTWHNLFEANPYYTETEKTTTIVTKTATVTWKVIGIGESSDVAPAGALTPEGSDLTPGGGESEGT